MDCSPQAPCPRDFPGKNPGVGCHFLLQGIFLTQGLNLVLLHCSSVASAALAKKMIREAARSGHRRSLKFFITLKAEYLIQKKKKKIYMKRVGINSLLLKRFLYASTLTFLKEAD